MKLGYHKILRKLDRQLVLKQILRELLCFWKKESTPEKIKSPTLEAPIEELDFIIQHASGKQLSEEQIAEAKHYARDLKYPKGSLVYNGTDGNL